MRPYLALLACATGLLLPTSPASAGHFEDEVRARWRGAWVVIGSETYSSCLGGYDDNKVSGDYVTSRAGYRFEPGELAKVDRVQVRRNKVDLMVTLEVPMLFSFQDGPFTLYNERECRVEMAVRAPRSLIKRKDVDAIDRLLAGVVQRFPSREDAFESSSWNGREREPYPADYELTLARHARWKAEQLNLAIDERLEVAVLQARDAAGDIDEDPEYLQGLAAGVDAMESWNVRDCERLLVAAFTGVRHHCAYHGEEHDPHTDPWHRGWEDGQRLIYHLALLERLDRCYVPVPEIPEHLLALEASPPRVSRAVEGN